MYSCGMYVCGCGRGPGAGLRARGDESRDGRVWELWTHTLSVDCGLCSHNDVKVH